MTTETFYESQRSQSTESQKGYVGPFFWKIHEIEDAPAHSGTPLL